MKRRNNGEGSRGWCMKNGNRIYRIRTYRDDGSIKEFTAKTKSSAEEKERRWLESGGDKCPALNGSLQFGEACMAWLENEKRYLLREGTYETYKYQIIGEILSASYPLKDILLKDITEDHLNQYYKSMLEKYAHKTIRDNWIIVKQFLTYANDRNWCRVPLDRVKLPNESLAKDKRVMHPLTDTDMLYFKEECLMCHNTGKRKHPAGDLFLFLLCSGMRVEEALALNFSDITDTHISINKTVKIINSRPKIQNLTKTAAGLRKIPLSEDLKDIIEIHKREILLINNPNKLLFPTLAGTYQDYHNLYRSLNNVLNAINGEHYDFSYRHITLHDLRHSFASKLIRHGCSAKEIQILLGHKDITVTLNTYVHIFNEQSLTNMNTFRLMG
jgi:integrase